MVTFATDVPLEPDAAAAGEEPELLVDDLLLEQPDRPTTTIAVAAAATVTERFTRFLPLLMWWPVVVDGPFGVCSFAGTADSEFGKN
jgi:hypothetical protein